MTLQRQPGPFVSARLPTVGVVNLVVHLPEELARRVEEVAAARHQSPEQVAIEAIDAQLAPPPEPGLRRRLAFVGIGSSNSGRGAAEADEMLAEGFGRD